MDNSEHQKDCICAWCEVDRQNVEIQSERKGVEPSGAAHGSPSSGLDSDSIVASCDCLTKTNEVKYHKPGCKYRLICERDDARSVANELAGRINRAACELVNAPTKVVTPFPPANDSGDARRAEARIQQGG